MSIAKVSHSPDGIYSWWRDLTRSVIAHGCAHSVSCNALQPKQAVLLSSITCKDESSNYQEYVQTHARLPGRPQHIAAARAHYATPLPRLRRQQAEITTHGRITLAPTAAAHMSNNAWGLQSPNATLAQNKTRRPEAGSKPNSQADITRRSQKDNAPLTSSTGPCQQGGRTIA